MDHLKTLSALCHETICQLTRSDRIKFYVKYEWMLQRFIPANNELIISEQNVVDPGRLSIANSTKWNNCF